jgi:hypothetical protein
MPHDCFPIDQMRVTAPRSIVVDKEMPQHDRLPYYLNLGKRRKNRQRLKANANKVHGRENLDSLRASSSSPSSHRPPPESLISTMVHGCSGGAVGSHATRDQASRKSQRDDDGVVS